MARDGIARSIASCGLDALGRGKAAHKQVQAPSLHA